jgi:tetratricopeptide (TPR) repeat protein
MAAMREKPDRVEGYYYLAVIKGRRIELAGLTGIGQIKDVESYGLKAAEIDPRFEDGGPFRLLAMLYAKAPPWPTSIGDMDLALEYAKKANAISPYPMNNLIMAEVLIEAGDYEQARKLLNKVLAAPKSGRWAREGERWRPYVRKLLKSITKDR